MAEALIVEQASNCANAPIHHVRRRDHVRSGAHVRKCLARQQFQSCIVVDVIIGDYSAMPMVGVFAHAHVGNYGQPWHVFPTPVVRAALPGLVADMSADSELNARVMSRFVGLFGAVRARPLAGDEREHALALHFVRPADTKGSSRPPFG